MSTKNTNRPTKISKCFRLDAPIVEALQKVAKEQNQKETWVVETILGVALGLRKLPKPMRLAGVAKEAR